MSGTLICYGDSNTYGYDSRSFTGERYEKHIRWTGILEETAGWRIRNHGINGRCIPHTSPQLRFACGQTEKWGQEEQGWMAVMLGTNDLLQEPGFTAEDAAIRMENFLRKLCETEAVKSGRLRLWLLSPPCMKRGAWVEEERICRESERLGREYQKAAERLEIKFTDTGKWEIPLLFDGVHFSEEGHRKFADRIAAECLSL